MVIKVKREQQIPVDGLIVNSSEHYVYLSTKNLDG
jgi:magnesium-transporting ATPase (P-type)